MRRFRVTFAKGEAVRYISHLDLMRTWERILRRARLKLAHTQGFNPRPRLVFAAPLPVGVTSEAEILDVVVEDELPAAEFQGRVGPALAPGVEVLSVEEIALEAPPVMARVESSDYTVQVGGEADLAAAVARFLARESVPYERTRKGAVKQADMRPAVLDLWAAGDGTLGMRLRLDVEGAAVRPEEVVAALDGGLAVRRVHRTGLRLKDAPGSHTTPSAAAAAEAIKAPHAA
jgi:radical SAM-linked protein